MTNTFEGWRKLGRFVRKGEKSIGRNSNNICIFNESQTVSASELITPRPIISYRPYDYDGFLDGQEESLEEGKLSENEIQSMVGYRRMMKERVRISASKDDPICGSYLALLDSHPSAKSIDGDLDYSDESDDIEMHY